MPDSCKLLAGPAAASAQLLLAVAAIGVLVLKRWHTVPSPAKFTHKGIPKVATQGYFTDTKHNHAVISFHSTGKSCGKDLWLRVDIRYSEARGDNEAFSEALERKLDDLTPAKITLSTTG
jgi:hypothetical protein